MLNLDSMGGIFSTLGLKKKRLGKKAQRQWEVTKGQRKVQQAICMMLAGETEILRGHAGAGLG